VKFLKEITVITNVSKKDLISFLNINGYQKIDGYIVDDIYYVPNDVNLDANPLDILKKSILVRSIDDKKHYLMYKYKEYDENENIINQGNSKVQVNNREDANIFLKTIGYKELIRIIDYIDVYEKDGLQIYIEDVNDKYLFIEPIDYDKSDYFVKKAKIVFEEKYRKNKIENI
jgi:adenylate cyclase class IV